MTNNCGPGATPFGDITPAGLAWVDRYGRAGSLGNPEFREVEDTTSVYLDRPAQRDDLDSGVIIISAADLDAAVDDATLDAAD